MCKLHVEKPAKATAMKKIFSFAALFAAGSLLLAQHVVLTEKAHGLAQDQVNDMKFSSYVDPGPSGEKQVWDLRGMEATKDFRGFVGASAATEKGAAFPSANVVLNEQGNQFYFCQEGRELNAYGMATPSGKVLMKYHSPYRKMVYPFRYGDEFSGSYEGTYFLSNGEAPIVGEYHVVADGYGKLILPEGAVVDQALRVVSTRSYDIMLGSTPQSYTIVTHRWYNNTERFPLAVLIETRSTACGQGNSSYKAAYKIPSIEEAPARTELALENEVKVYPNPVMHQFAVEYTVHTQGPVLLELYDNAGKKVTNLVDREMQTGTYEESFNSDEYSLMPGMYFIRSTIGSRSSSTSFIRER